MISDNQLTRGIQSKKHMRPGGGAPGGGSGGQSPTNRGLRRVDSPYINIILNSSKSLTNSLQMLCNKCYKNKPHELEKSVSEECASFGTKKMFSVIWLRLSDRIWKTKNWFFIPFRIFRKIMDQKKLLFLSGRGGDVVNEEKPKMLCAQEVWIESKKFHKWNIF